MEKLLLVGGDIATPDVINYCKEIGVHTIMTNDIPYENNPYKQMADEAWEIPVEELDILEAKCREVGITGVFAGVNEHNLDMTQALAKRLGLPFYASDEGWACARNKGRFKEHCAAIGLDVPKRYHIQNVLDSEELSEICYPVMVKPADSAASQGLSVCYNESDLCKAFDKAVVFSATGDVIVEDYIEGVDVVFAFSLINQKAVIHRVSASYPVQIDNRRTIGFGTPSSFFWSDFEKKHSSHIEALFERIGISQGSLNIQTVYKDGRYYILEIGYRLDGAGTWRNFKAQYGSSPLEMHVDIQLGRKEHNWALVAGVKPSANILSGYFLYCKPGRIKRIVGLNTLENMKGLRITVNRYKEGDVVAACDNMYHAAFFILITAKDEAETSAVLKNINQAIHFYDDNENDMLIYFDDYSIFETGIEK